MTTLPMPSLTELPSGVPMSLRRVCAAYFTEVKYESLRMLRSPGFSIPFLLLPVPVYLFFGVMLAAPAVAKQAALADYLFSGFSVFAIMGPALFGVGCVLAIEREAGYLKLKRAFPAPGGAYLIAKMVMAMVFALLAMSTLLVAALLVRQDHAVGDAVDHHDAGADDRRAALRRARAADRRLRPGQRRSGDCERHLSADDVAVGAVHPAAEVPRAVGGDLAGVPPESSGARRGRRLGVQLHAAGNLGRVLLAFTVVFGGLAIRRLARKG